MSFIATVYIFTEQYRNIGRYQFSSSTEHERQYYTMYILEPVAGQSDGAPPAGL